MLIAARSIVHSDPRGGGYAGAQVAAMIERLGIADVVRPKVTFQFAIAGGVAAVARGDAEIGLFNISEIVPVEGVVLVGPLPPELQSTITFAGAVYGGSAAPEAALSFLQYLAGADTHDAWRAGGFEPLGDGH
jgi:molybdate transport system substrate-binding protein